MKFTLFIAAAAAIKINDPLEPTPYTDSDSTDAGVMRNPPINKHSEVMYNVTHPLPFHQHTIPVEEWDTSETNFGAPYARLAGGEVA